MRSNHPSEETLALYAAGDLAAIERWHVRRHAGKCLLCEETIAGFRSTRARIRQTAAAQSEGVYSGSEWLRLEREMTGNIIVGLDAARCIENVGRRHGFFPRWALITLGLAILFSFGWLTHIPSEQNRHLFASLSRAFHTQPAPIAPAVIVKSTHDALSVRAQGSTLLLKHPPSAVISLSGASGVAASYVDEDTGQLTIANVYGQ